MRRTIILALGTAVALATAAVAIAVTSVTGISTTTATFTTDKVADLKTRSCTADGKIYEITKAHYTGAMVSTSSSSTGILDGALTIRAHTTYDTTGKLGYVEGSFRVRDDDSRVKGRFWGTLSDGKLVGFLEGKARGSHAKVLGNLSAAFVPATGFTGGMLGTGASNVVLAVIAGPACEGEQRDNHESGGPKSDKPARPLSVEGVAAIIQPVSTAGLSTITVTKHGTTTPPCVIPAVFGLPAGANGAMVEMKCEWVTGGTPPAAVLTLTKLKLHK